MSGRLVRVAGVVAVIAAAAGARADGGNGAERVVARAREEVARGVAYDSAYVRLSYPGGDPAPDRGVCTDVAIRALREVGLDLQQKVHEDVLRRPTAYPRIAQADANIDHRRVGNLLVWFGGHETALTKETKDASTWKAGDVVVWAFHACPRCSPDHIGLLSDRVGPRGLPLVIHNLGPRPTEDDTLDAWTILGHFRVREITRP